MTHDAPTHDAPRLIKLDIQLTLLGVWGVDVDEAIFRIHLGDVWDLGRWVDDSGMAHSMAVTGDVVAPADLQAALQTMGLRGEFQDDGMFQEDDETGD